MLRRKIPIPNSELTNLGKMLTIDSILSYFVQLVKHIRSKPEEAFSIISWEV